MKLTQTIAQVSRVLRSIMQVADLGSGLFPESRLDSIYG